MPTGMIRAADRTGRGRHIVTVASYPARSNESDAVRGDLMPLIRIADHPRSALGDQFEIRAVALEPPTEAAVHALDIDAMKIQEPLRTGRTETGQRVRYRDMKLAASLADQLMEALFDRGDERPLFIRKARDFAGRDGSRRRFWCRGVRAPVALPVVGAFRPASLDFRAECRRRVCAQVMVPAGIGAFDWRRRCPRLRPPIQGSA